MKPWPLFIGILFILAMFCAPALAISKSDLISQYKAGQFSGPTTPTPTPTVIPTTVPTQAPSNWYYPIYYPSVIEHRPCEDCDPSSMNCILCTPVPTQAPSIWPYPIVTDSSIKTKSSDGYYEYSKFPAPEPKVFSDEEFQFFLAHRWLPSWRSTWL